MMNEHAHFVINDEEFDTSILIETGTWTYSQIIDQNEDEHGCCGGGCGHEMQACVST
jgi:hypothetical protein